MNATEMAPESASSEPSEPRGAEELLALLAQKMGEASAKKSNLEGQRLAGEQGATSIMSELGENMGNLRSCLNGSEIVIYEGEDLRTALKRHLEIIEVAIASASAVTPDTLNLSPEQASALTGVVTKIREKMGSEATSDEDILKEFVALSTTFDSFGIGKK